MDPSIEAAVVKMAFDFPAFGHVWVSNELRKQGIFVYAAGMRCVGQGHDLERFDKWDGISISTDLFK